MILQPNLWGTVQAQTPLSVQSSSSDHTSPADAVTTMTPPIYAMQTPQLWHAAPRSMTHPPGPELLELAQLPHDPEFIRSMTAPVVSASSNTFTNSMDDQSLSSPSFSSMTPSADFQHLPSTSAAVSSVVPTPAEDLAGHDLVGSPDGAWRGMNIAAAAGTGVSYAAYASSGDGQFGSMGMAGLGAGVDIGDVDLLNLNPLGMDHIQHRP